MKGYAYRVGEAADHFDRSGFWVLKLFPVDWEAAETAINHQGVAGDAGARPGLLGDAIGGSRGC